MGGRAESSLPRHGSKFVRRWPARILAASAVPIFFLLAGCGGSASGNSSNGTFSISPGSATVDTNCTGCNANNSGTAVEQFSATLSGGGAASVNWSVSGGDAYAGAGSITSSGQYTPPPYLTADSVRVTVKATLTSGTGTSSATLTVTPGFLEPLSPENVALGGGGSVSITGYITEVGGSTGITYNTSSTSTGTSGGMGSVSSPSCVHGNLSNGDFTYCTATYTAPTTLSSTGTTYVVATIGSSSSKTASEVLLNTEGISSNPATHQTKLATPILLGSSGGNNNHYDTQGGQIADCCGGTLGALIQNSSNTQYILSCNHVLARSDQASMGEQIIQPGLIDDDCEPTNGTPAGTETPVGVLTAWLPLSSSSTNADAAIAAVNSNVVTPTGAIMELGTPGAGGVLAAAPPGSLPSSLLRARSRGDRDRHRHGRGQERAHHRADLRQHFRGRS